MSKFRQQVRTDGLRHWCDSVDDTFHPKLYEELKRGVAQAMVPETFLASAMKYLRATADELDQTRAELDRVQGELDLTRQGSKP
jgi:hypothetical protein